MAQNTAGISLSYGVEATAGTAPTTWTKIPGISEIPEIGGSPETYEDTTLDNLEFKTYTDGLKDTGGALGFSANDTPAFRTAVTNLITAQNAAAEEGKATWFKIEIPEPVDENMKFTGKATPLGFGGASINSVLTTTLYITVTGEPTWSANA